MRTKLVTVTAAGLLALGGIAVAGPALAATGTTGTATSGATSRVERVAQALAGLVSDGSISQEQADEVATTLDDADLGGRGGGHGGGHDLGAAASALGMTEADLRTALQADGATLASVAGDQGVAVDALVDALVAAAQEQVAAAVTAGDLTQEQADARLADLEARTADRVERAWADRPARTASSEDEEPADAVGGAASS